MVLDGHPDQPDVFKRRFRNLVELVLAGNFQDSDVRRVMELLSVSLEGDD